MAKRLLNLAKSLPKISNIKPPFIFKEVNGEKAVQSFFDVLDGKILTKGRLNDTGIKVADFISYFADRGIKYVKLTDVAKDGALEGPNFGLIAELRKQFPHIHFLSSGGIRHTQDIYELESLGVAGVIIARAFYEDLVSIDDLVALNNRRA
jgi:phosphoribosylformimino-5-aminoimidazole carboxamide ribotide isomerase